MSGNQPSPRPARFTDTLKAVGASFFGVRGRRAHERDVARLNPLHVIIAGLLMAALFILILVSIVRMVTR